MQKKNYVKSKFIHLNTIIEDKNLNLLNNNFFAIS